MTFKRIYIKFNNGAVFNYTDQDGFTCNISSSSITINVSHQEHDSQHFSLNFDRNTITFYRYEQTESGNGTE